MAKVLVVDDHLELRNLIAKFLKKRGYQVQEVESGKAAVDCLNNNAVDVVVADLYLPGALNGIDVLSHHKKISPTGTRILCTALLSDNVRAVCEYINAVYLPKPFQLPELSRAITAALARRCDASATA